MHQGVVSLFAAVAVVVVSAASLSAQTRPAASGPPNAVQGFSTNKDKPIHIEAQRLEVRDKDKVATFSGDVQVVQGDTELRCRTLVVFYEPDKDTPGGAASAAAAAPAPGAGSQGEQKIKRLEARGGVVVTQNDQIATGDSALFEMASNTVTLIGNVVVTQGQNVLRGERLVVDLNTGVSKVFPGKGGDGRVQGLFLPGSNGSVVPQVNPLQRQQPQQQRQEPRRPASRAPGEPLRLN
ncbi:MAG: LptA/OstA family protein [Pseudolabrys sp.]